MASIRASLEHNAPVLEVELGNVALGDADEIHFFVKYSFIKFLQPEHIRACPHKAYRVDASAHGTPKTIFPFPLRGTLAAPVIAPVSLFVNAVDIIQMACRASDLARENSYLEIMVCRSAQFLDSLTLLPHSIKLGSADDSRMAVLNKILRQFAPVLYNMF